MDQGSVKGHTSNSVTCCGIVSHFSFHTLTPQIPNRLVFEFPNFYMNSYSSENISFVDDSESER